jgi:hypothetical protein
VDGKLTVGGIKSNINKAYFLTDASKRKLPIEFLNAETIEITLPAKAIDTINTVIVLDMNGKIETDSMRFVSTNVSTRLLAYDAELKGKGFSFGDGKTGRYFVEGWKQMDQEVNWGFKIVAPSSFKVVIKYVTTPDTEGTFQLKSGTKSFTEKVVAAPKGNEVVTEELGTVDFFVGINEIKIKPVQISKKELMKILEVELIPVKNK